MTNEMIIFNESVKLMEEGIIEGTGNFVTVENEDGEKVELEEPEQIHTYAGWKALKRQVKKGEKSIAYLSLKWEDILFLINQERLKRNCSLLKRRFLS